MTDFSEPEVGFDDEEVAKINAVLNASKLINSIRPYNLHELVSLSLLYVRFCSDVLDGPTFCVFEMFDAESV